MKLKHLSAFGLAGFVCSALNNAVYVCPSSEAFVLISQTVLLRDRQTDRQSHRDPERGGMGGEGARKRREQRASQPNGQTGTKRPDRQSGTERRDRQTNWQRETRQTNWHRETRQTDKLAQRDKTDRQTGTERQDRQTKWHRETRQTDK